MLISRGAVMMRTCSVSSSEHQTVMAIPAAGYPAVDFLFGAGCSLLAHRPARSHVLDVQHWKSAPGGWPSPGPADSHSSGRSLDDSRIGGVVPVCGHALWSVPDFNAGAHWRPDRGCDRAAKGAR